MKVEPEVALEIADAKCMGDSRDVTATSNGHYGGVPPSNHACIQHATQPMHPFNTSNHVATYDVLGQARLGTHEVPRQPKDTPSTELCR